MVLQTGIYSARQLHDKKRVPTTHGPRGPLQRENSRPSELGQTAYSLWRASQSDILWCPARVDPGEPYYIAANNHRPLSDAGKMACERWLVGCGGSELTIGALSGDIRGR